MHAPQKKRRAFGQHFLISSKAIRTLCEKLHSLLAEKKCETLLEVGPGKGALTLPILEGIPNNVKKFVLVERDPHFFQRWQKHTSDRVPLEVHCGDFVQLPSSLWDTTPPIGVISNLPYSSSVAILNRLASHTQKIAFMLLTFQWEVAQRICSPIDAKKRGSLSVWMQNLWDVSPFLTIPPGAFRPPPKVRSQAVLFVPRPEPRVTQTNQYPLPWESLLKNAFSQPRKMLRALCAMVPSLQNALERSGVDGTKRASALNWEEWNQLFLALLQVTEIDPWDL